MEGAGGATRGRRSCQGCGEEQELEVHRVWDAGAPASEGVQGQQGGGPGTCRRPVWRSGVSGHGEGAGGPAHSLVPPACHRGPTQGTASLLERPGVNAPASWVRCPSLPLCSALAVWKQHRRANGVTVAQQHCVHGTWPQPPPLCPGRPHPFLVRSLAAPPVFGNPRASAREGGRPASRGLRCHPGESHRPVEGPAKQAT